MEFAKAQYLVYFFLIIYKWSIPQDYKNKPVKFSDDNTIIAAETTIENLISTLETESQATIEWFKLKWNDYQSWEMSGS